MWLVRLPEICVIKKTIMSDTVLYIALAALLGLVVGSFLNVVVYRLPIMLERGWRREARAVLALPPGTDDEQRFNLLVPASACPHCHAPVKPWQNIPVLSFLLLKARCHSCHTPISWRYPLVEMLTAVAFAVVVWRFGWNETAWMGLLFTAVLLALTFIDVDTQLLPDQLTLPLIWLGLLFNLWLGFVPLTQAVLGAVLGYLSLWSLFWLFKLLTGKDGMGYGDFKLLAALGAWLGAATLPVIVLMAALVGIVASIILKVARNQPMSFGPALAIAGWIVFVANEPIKQAIQWWLHSAGLA